jgi:hypothetical protein
MRERLRKNLSQRIKKRLRCTEEKVKGVGKTGKTVRDGRKTKILAVHSPAYPVTHVQLNAPTLSTHVPPFRHGADKHSSTSWAHVAPA